MTKVLWLLQITLALTLFIDGIQQLMGDYVGLAEESLWMRHCSPVAAKVKGVIEIIGAAGLVTPMRSSLYPSLNLIAAMGVVLIICGVIITHFITGAPLSLTSSIIIGVLATLISLIHLKRCAWTRL